MLTRLIAATALVAAAMTVPAAAAQPPRVKAYSCSALKRTLPVSQIWSTWIYGERRNLFGPNDAYQNAPCFKSLANCKAWLYWAQTDWNIDTRMKPCHRGLP
jgi:hypothetical protein